MDIKNLWESETEKKQKEEQVKQLEEMKEVELERRGNLINDTDVLAEMLMANMLESQAMQEEIKELKTQINGLRGGVNGK